MDQGLKERLVGAAVLVAIGVWLIPWVLDGPDEPLEADSNSLRLPAAEEPMPMRTQTLRFEGADEPPIPGNAEVEAPPPVEAAVRAAEPASGGAVAEAPNTGASKPASGAAKPAEEPAKNVVVASSPPRTPAPAAAAGDWVVQLGSFSEEANARRLAQRVSTFGYRANVEDHRSGGRTLFRVRVGPYDTRSKADAAASALGAHGFKGQVVAAAD